MARKSVTPVEQELQITVSDDADSMSPQNVPQVFLIDYAAANLPRPIRIKATLESVYRLEIKNQSGLAIHYTSRT